MDIFLPFNEIRSLIIKNQVVHLANGESLSLIQDTNSKIKLKCTSQNFTIS